ncbi:GGDEF domain-containing protein [Sphingomonas sp. 37zxx]|uniref:GGDEF domain-containing protein n=1 Tax=Sphingomonas sp. 37zxx TaxID=1550073 RepID=UPI0018CE36F6|nr:diguanylate cyclase [Sphingomonas sp. 37zxx]
MIVDRAPDEGALLARATRLAGIGAWRCDLADDRLAWTEGVYGLFGVACDVSLDRREVVTWFDEESRDILERLRCDAIARRGNFNMDARIIRPDGETRWIRIRAEYGHIPGGAGELYGLKQDITEERTRWEALRRLADCDALTGLASRGTFQRDFLDRDSVAGSLVLLDIDGFKPTNDRFGHAAGDACLVAVAHRLRAAFADAKMVARIGGDEFAVVARGAPEAVAKRVKSALCDLSLPVSWGSGLLALSASAGMASCRDHERMSAEALFVAADTALYAAKRAGRNRLMISPSAMSSQFSKGRSIR